MGHIGSTCHGNLPLNLRIGRFVRKPLGVVRIIVRVVFREFLTYLYEEQRTKWPYFPPLDPFAGGQSNIVSSRQWGPHTGSAYTFGGRMHMFLLRSAANGGFQSKKMCVFWWLFITFSPIFVILLKGSKRGLPPCCGWCRWPASSDSPEIEIRTWSTPDLYHVCWTQSAGTAQLTSHDHSGSPLANEAFIRMRCELL